MPQNALPTTPDDLFTILKELNIDYKLHRHEAVFSVNDAEKVEHDIEGAHCRNLFLRDKKKNMFLVTAQNETKIDLKKLEKRLACARISFGSPERLFQYLGVRPGSVCPFAIINDKDHEVRSILEEDMMNQPLVAYHPLFNTMTIVLTPTDLIKFFEHINHTYEIVDLKCVRPEDEK
ncbi:MAG: prolyl-tRNA synthetase associated domain-containing protein [Alphaproteobacteria bacterium]|nr:prolyl-tRNA synthetase associated domain-containing protein [Alphaproteobacteria bacterium]